MPERVHILGICGTFMGGVALLARELGFKVTGSDANVYPPMSTMLADAGIDVMQGYQPQNLEPAPDVVIVGNALSRGNPEVEALLNRGIPYISGPQWLKENLLSYRWVIAVSGTHGKTTTSSMLLGILESVGLTPGYLIGGVPKDFGRSARLGSSDYFIVEADEYDSAFFDKRSKFVHYLPKTLVIGNLEFDHADIFDDLEAIQRQFHHLVRCVPGNGQIIHGTDDSILEVLDRGLWTPAIQMFESEESAQGAWTYQNLSPAYERLRLTTPDGESAELNWDLIGRHNALNALAAVAAAKHVGVGLVDACAALSDFAGVTRRMDVIGVVDDVTVYDDFAHHPTAIATTLDGLRRKLQSGRIHAVIELRSNTMKDGHHADALIPSTRKADAVYWFKAGGQPWLMTHSTGGEQHSFHNDLQALVEDVRQSVIPRDHVVIMSNGGFGGFHQQLLKSLRK
jgi:UDP-N-acetylmuramate: L-alanyl-gamma-D-glutamyl-meso-diaminopimelate ligase